MVQEAYRLSLKPKEKLDDLARLALSVKGLPGVFVEFGVFKGGSAILLSKYVYEKFLYLADSFEGMPEPGDNDVRFSHEEKHRKGDTCAALDEVSSLKALKGDNIIFIKGWIVDTKEYFAQFPEEVSLLHIDVDYEQPYKDILKYMYPRVVKGGVVVFDDYGCYVGAKLAVDDFIKTSGEKLCRTGETTQRYIIKENEMGDIKKVLFKGDVQEPYCNRTFVVELCENVHLHYRNLRLEFQKEEFLLILRKLKSLDEKEINEFAYGEGHNFLINDHDLPEKTEFNDRFQIEELVSGMHHIHYKNMRIEFRNNCDGFNIKDIKLRR